MNAYMNKDYKEVKQHWTSLTDMGGARERDTPGYETELNRKEHEEVQTNPPEDKSGKIRLIRRHMQIFCHEISHDLLEIQTGNPNANSYKKFRIMVRNEIKDFMDATGMERELMILEYQDEEMYKLKSKWKDIGRSVSSLLYELGVTRKPDVKRIDQLYISICIDIEDFMDATFMEYEGSINMSDLLRNEPEETVLKVLQGYIDTKPTFYKDRDRNGYTMLHKAVQKNFRSVAELLIDSGVSQLDYALGRIIPLHIAIHKGFDAMAALLVSKLPKLVVTRMFGQLKKRTLETPSNHKFYSFDFSGTYRVYSLKQLFTMKDLISEELDKTLLQVLNSFENKNTDSIHIELLDTDNEWREPDHPYYNCNNQTTFQLLVREEKKDVINHPVIRAYVDYKWNQWYQKIFLFKFCFYLFGLFCLTYAAVTGVTASDVHTYDTPLQHSRAVMEVISYLYALAVLFCEIRQMLRQKRSYFAKFFNFLELFSAILMLVVLPLRYTHLRAHWYVFALGYFLWAIRIFKYGFVFSQTSIYAEVIKRIVVKDFVQFSILMVVINTIFTGTFLLVLKADDSLDAHIDTSSFQGILYVGVRTLIEAAPIVDYTGSDGYRVAGTMVMLVYLFVTIVVMLNILIAQLSETYKRTYDECMENVHTNRAKTIGQAMSNEGNSYLSGLLSWRKFYKSKINHVDMKNGEKNSLSLKDILGEIEIIRKKQTDIVSEVKTVTANVKQFSENIEKKLDDLRTIVHSDATSETHTCDCNAVF